MSEDRDKEQETEENLWHVELNPRRGHRSHRMEDNQVNKQHECNKE